MALPAQTKHKELVAGLKVFGYEGPFSTKGSSNHPLFMRRGTHTLHIPNPHKGDIRRNLLSDVLMLAGISDDEWMAAKARKWSPKPFAEPAGESSA